MSRYVRGRNVPIAEGTIVSHGKNEYRIGNLLKSGGFGQVFEAQRTKPDTLPIVVKIPASHVANDPVWSKKFEREARILANIKHRNVVKIIAFWKFPDGGMALAQERVSNALPLNEYIRNSPGHEASIYIQALYALRAFHGSSSEAAAVHRDLSPANILVDGDGIVKIIDFGLAKEDPRASEVLTRTGEWFGTLGCMAPEQVDASADVDHRADLFSLGRSVAASLQRRNVLHADPAALPEPWRSICIKLTEHEANNRYPSANEALSEAFIKFAASGVPLSNFDIHLNEMRSHGMIPGWAEICQAHYSKISDLEMSDIELASHLNSAVFVGAFDANSFFDKLEASTALQAFDSGDATFEECDPLGVLYRRLYAALDVPRKLRCFERLCKTAKNWHRYAVMQNIRDTFSSEMDNAVRTQLLAILDKEDPDKDVHGWSVIPGR
ncbi:serine/threonine protein kinase [Corallococcus exiguus]|uniref:serine/threonine protein kinase n=1 Tax=Corallococcus exiguus TaxID=83462 RepID=UPI00155FBFF6|nr:serine/threonine-protein kinase [Corallococcus exiguus]NRD67499.1 serine/threonine protein kinase [Corallococcus exiguus]